MSEDDSSKEDLALSRKPIEKNPQNVPPIDESEPEEDEKAKKLRILNEQFLALQQQIENKTKSKSSSEKRPQNKASTSSNNRNDESSEIKGEEQSSQPSRKSKNRERETLEMVCRFKKRMKQASEKIDGRIANSYSNQKNNNKPNLNELDEELDELDKLDDDTWLTHKFQGRDDSNGRLSESDSNNYDDWYKISDPRKEFDNSHNSNNNYDKRRDSRTNDDSSKLRHSSHRHRSHHHHHQQQQQQQHTGTDHHHYDRDNRVNKGSRSYKYQIRDREHHSRSDRY